MENWVFVLGGGGRVASGRLSAHQLYHVVGRYSGSRMRHSAVEQEEEGVEEEEEGRQACTPPPRPQRHLSLCRGNHGNIPQSLSTLSGCGDGWVGGCFCHVKKIHLGKNALLLLLHPVGVSQK